MWWRIKMFNTKLTITNAMRKLRVCALVSTRPFWGVPWLSALFSALAVWASVTTLCSRGTSARAATPWSNLIRGMMAVGMLSRLLFQGVHPVTRSISPHMRRESCALKVGSVSGFPTGLVWVGGAPPPVPPLLGLPLLLPPLPRSDCLGNVAAGNLHPLKGTLRCINVDFSVDQSFGVDDR